jgi:hypothetical protein
MCCMFPRLLKTLALGSVCLAGCRAPDLTDEVDAYVSQTNFVRSTLCYCMVVADPDLECDASLDLFIQLDAECMVASLDGHEREGEEFLGCVNAALDTYVQCVSVNSEACEEAINTGCTSAYETAIAGCSQLPTDVRAAFEACGG